MSDYMDDYERRKKARADGIAAVRASAAGAPTKAEREYLKNYISPETLFVDCSGGTDDDGYFSPCCHADAINALFEQQTALWLAYDHLRNQYEQANLLSPRTRLEYIPEVRNTSGE